MFTKYIVRMLGATVGLGAFVFLCSSPVFAATNLLTNPGAESNGTGWNTILNGGDGMSYNFDGVVRSGTQSFQTSHGLDSISQAVDLFANGYSVSSMTSSPSITLSIWVRSRNDQAGQYYVRFALLQQDGTTVVTSTDFGTSGALVQLPAGTDWFEVSYTFSNYGPGVRYASIEFGGRDQSGWAGNYGTHFDDASITVASVVAQDTGGGALSMPWWGYVPPKGPFSISLREGGSITHTPEVVLNILASSDVDRMALSRHEDFHGNGIVPLASSVPWSVCGAPTCDPGTYDVYAKFYQSYGLSSPVQHLVITYALADSESLTQTTSIASVTSSTSSTLPTSASDSIVAVFTRNLRRGDQGIEVKRLQEFLNTHGYLLAKKGAGSPGQETDIFGPALKYAIIHFQEANTEKLLTPFGLKKGTGIFGTQTRNFVNGLLRER